MKIVDIIDGISIDVDVFTTYFRCRYDLCNGACCGKEKINGVELLGGKLTTPEVLEIREKRDDLIRLLDFYKVGVDKFFELSECGATTCLRKDGSCVFSINKLKGCVFKEAHKEGIISFPIPQFCGLYPLNFDVIDGSPTLYMDYLWSRKCKESFKEGKLTDTTVINFCEESLTRTFGKYFVSKLKVHAYSYRKHLDSNK